jgi:homoserine kinase
MRAVTAFAPATVANLGPGLDSLALAVEGAGDEVRIERAAEPGIRISVEGCVDGFAEIPCHPSRNTAGIAAGEVLRRAGSTAPGLAITLRKGIPLAGGQGGSAASAAAAAVATDALIGAALFRQELLEACLAAEEVVAGRHADNVSAALWGGVVLVRDVNPCDVVTLAFPERLRVVLVEPEQRLATRQARSALPESVARATAVFQAAQVGALVAALASGDLALLRRAVEDRIAEPSRSGLLPGFAQARAAALAAGACGCSISGAGPAAFAFADGNEAGARIAEAMVASYRHCGVSARGRVCRIASRGARVLSVEEA